MRKFWRGNILNAIKKMRLLETMTRIPLALNATELNGAPNKYLNLP